jgi:hypothetical protein
MAQRQNTYEIIDTSTKTTSSIGAIVDRRGGLDNAIARARELGTGHVVAHCSALLSSSENNANVEASRSFYEIVATDMRGLPIEI